MPAAFNLPIQSVNRGLYSNPQDVLLPNHQNAGIAAFPVQAIPMPKQHPQNAAQVYSLAVLHVPEQDNFSHSEIHGLLNGNADDSMPKSLRKAFRTDLFQQVNILQEPTA